MSKRFTGKYFLIGLLSTVLAGSAVAQNTQNHKKKQKTELPANDTTKTLTHSTPISAVKTPPMPPKNKFLVGHMDDSYQIGVGAFANMTTDATRTVFVPNITIKPFVRICDRYTIGVYANAIVHNYMCESFSPIVNEMYLTTAAQTNIGKFDIRVGKIAAINYPEYFSQSVPFENLLMLMFRFDAQRYLPRAAIVTFSTKETVFGIGYTENTDGFGFSGNGYVVMTLTQKIGDEFQVGGFVSTNKKESYGDFYTAHRITPRDILILQLLGFGARPVFYGIYQHTLRNGEAAIAINGFTQSDDGPAGADIAFQHIKSGTYVSAGAHYNNPLHITVPDAPAKWKPFVQVGINKTLAPKKSR